jgi:glycolate oxidase FAD binding subunit
MIAQADLRALRDAVGAQGLREHEAGAPPGLPGTKIGVTLIPPDGDALQRVVGVLGARRLAVVIRGGGSKLWLGNPPQRADAILSTEALAGVETLDADEGVVQVSAGTAVAELRAQAVRASWEPALDPASPRATVGGVIATGEIGPRCLRFGRPRDSVLGLGVILGSGERTRCGGRVVKNVTGYDLAKLYTGSFGTLGVIESAWLRLKPRADRVLGLLAPGGDCAAALQACARAARLSSARCVALVDRSFLEGVAESEPLRAGVGLVIELAGEAPVVEREAGRLRAELGAEPGKDDVVGLLHAAHAEPPAASFVRMRLSCRRSAMARVLDGVRSAGAAVLAYPEAGLLWARFSLERDADEVAAGRLLRALREALREGEGSALLEALPEWLAQGRDVFVDAPGALPLLRALKGKFDPAGVLNPGRFAARL